MDWSLIIFIAVIAFFTYRGYRKGLLKSLSRILSLVAGYIAAILYTGQLAAFIESQTLLRGLVALISASVILFFAAGFAVGIIFWVISKIMRENENSSATSSIGGALAGLLVGVLVAVVIVWTYAFMRDMQATTEITESEKPDKSAIESLTSRVASKAVKAALVFGDAKSEIAKLGAALVESPAEIAQQAKRLTNSNELGALLGDPKNQRILNSGDIEAVKTLSAFQQLASNPDMQALAISAGMLDDSPDGTTSIDTALASRLTDTWGRMQRVKNDQRVQAILQNPEFQQKIQSDNPLDLLTNSGLLELADIIFEDGGEVPPINNETQGQSKKENKIFSWTDDKGRVHYSDEEPE